MAPARPVSQILPHHYDVFFESPPVLQQQRPARVRTSHYRPFSTLYTESPYIDLPADKSSARLLKRSSSIGALHAFAAMGINFAGKDKPKAKKDPPRSSPLASGSEFGGVKTSTPIKAKALPNPPRPSTSTGVTRPAPGLFKIKKKRSMVNLFTGTPEAAAATTHPAGAAHTRPHVIAPKSDASVRTIKTSRNNNATSFKDEDASFVPRSVWAKRHNMTLHPYQGDVPYMQAYDPILLESDRYTDLLLQHLSQGAPSFHDFGRKPPAMALDLGCGQGHWVLHAASIWKTSQITGLDLVNITLPTFEVTENARFIQGNFLFRLPFDDKSFEFVRMANLVLCIPRDKWPSVLREVRRVLTPGGRLEIVDDQMWFPYGDVPKNKTHKKNTSVSSFEDSDDDDLFEDSTLQDDSSAETECTLISDEGGIASSFDDKEPHLSESVTVRPLSAMGGRMSTYLPPSPEFVKPRLPAVFRNNAKCPPPPNSYLKESKQLAWIRQAFASRQLELSFEHMLATHHRVLVQPSEEIVEFMQGVFGKDAAGKVGSFHIKLAPHDSPIGPAATKAKAEAEAEREERTKRSKKEKKEVGKKKEGGDGSGSGSSSKRSSLEAPLLPTPVPATMNAKAAARLGLPHHMTAKAAGRLGYDLSPDVATFKERDALKEREKSFEQALEREPPAITLSAPSPKNAPLPPTPSTPMSLIPPPPVISAKAAGRLGISYSALTQASAASGRTPVRTKPDGPAQSPGLLVWPSTYIAMGPSELEMHACKYIHTLLGCRPAIAEWAAGYKDADGQRIVEDYEFEEAVWDYECFRRPRFNWPSEIADPYDDDDACVSAEAPISANSGSILPRENFDTFNGQYLRDELTHLRTIRVFNAVKPEEDTSFLTMIRSKSFSPKI